MKRNRIFAALVFTALMAFGMAACSNASDTYIINNYTDEKTEKTYSVEVMNLVPKTVDLRWVNPKTGKVATDCQVPLGFKAGDNEIPYFAVKNDSLSIFFNIKDKGIYDVSKVTTATKKVTVTNTLSGSKAVIDLSHRKIVFENYDAFFQKNDAYHDIAGLTGVDIDYMKMVYAANIAGKPLTVYWGGLKNMHVGIWQYQGECSLAFPLQTFCDIFMVANYASLYYNGTYLYSNLGDKDKLLAKEYYSAASTGKRSKALAEYCYDELCFNLDLNYGLKAIHGMENFNNFDEFFGLVGVREALKSEKCLEFSNALKDVCDFYFDDGHSNYMYNSWRLGKDAKVPGTKVSFMNLEYAQNEDKYIRKGRNLVLGTGAYHKETDPVPCYEVSGDGKTAIVRFDSFTDNDANIAALNEQLVGFDDSKMAVYAGSEEAENAVETAAMIHAVNEKIKALGSSVENVVLDLSCNGGGSCRAAAFVLSWMLGRCYFDLTDSITGAKCTAVYNADVDFDGKYDARDTIMDKKLFCIVSPLSFSCGNMVPAMLKASGNVTILGATSSGGTSVVNPSSAADGTVFRFSSKQVMSVTKNGSNYDIDQGIEPDYRIHEPANFYTTSKIVELLATIK